MARLFSHHRGFWNERNQKSLYLSLLLFALAIAVQITAGTYSTINALKAPFVGDLFLDNLPVIRLNFVIIQGSMIIWTVAFIFMLLRPKYLIFGLKAVSLFIITRAFFINLTHIGIYPNHAINYDAVEAGHRIYWLFTFQGNYFFSGHTGLPFLLALLVWPEKWWRRFFFFISFVFGSSVLLAHEHYSIDVFAAPFMIYGIWKIAQRLFPGDYALTRSENPLVLTGKEVT